MWGVSLKLFLFLFILKSFVAVGNAYPTTSSDIEAARDNNIMTQSTNDAATSVTPYTCVYIPPNLESCKFINYKSRENLWSPMHKLPENEKPQLLESNKIYFTSRPSMRVPGMKRFQRQPFVKIIIYEIQRCVPPRMPFVLPWCTDEDLSEKKSQILRLFPFAIDGFSKATYEFPNKENSVDEFINMSESRGTK